MHSRGEEYGEPQEAGGESSTRPEMRFFRLPHSSNGGRLRILPVDTYRSGFCFSTSVCEGIALVSRFSSLSFGSPSSSSSAGRFSGLLLGLLKSISRLGCSCVCVHPSGCMFFFLSARSPGKCEDTKDKYGRAIKPARASLLLLLFLFLLPLISSTSRSAILAHQRGLLDEAVSCAVT